MVQIQNRNKANPGRCKSIYSNHNYDSLKQQLIGNQLDDYMTRNKQFGMVRINEENMVIN